jgi:hypothetical protein
MCGKSRRRDADPYRKSHRDSDSFPHGNSIRDGNRHADRDGNRNGNTDCNTDQHRGNGECGREEFRI